MKRRIECILLLLLGALFWLGCSDDSTGSSCSSDDSCNRGNICEDGSCAEVECINRSDCGSNRVCLDEGLCSATECFTADDCEAGQNCVRQICVGGGGGGCVGPEDCAASNQVCNPISQACESPNTDNTCAQDWQCVHPRVCDTTTGMCTQTTASCGSDAECTDSARYCEIASGQCLVGCREDTCLEGEVCDLSTRQCGPAMTCTQADCASNQACDPASGQCIDRSETGQCGECTPGSSGECGAPGVDRCVPLGGTGRCIFACDSAEDCTGGFICAEISATNPEDKYCQPTNGRCEGCVVDGCPDAGTGCNPSSGMCEAQRGLCETCVTGLCEDGFQCTEFDNDSACLPRCDNGEMCPIDYTCNAVSGFCESNSGSCAPSCTLMCGAPNPVLDAANCRCVECNADTDCSSGQICNNNVCQGMGMGGGCTSAADCDDGNSDTDNRCDTSRGTCYIPGECTSDAECPRSCGSFFPVCTCESETDTTNCRDGESCIGTNDFGSPAWGCFAF